ncbi:Hpt domain-containing protein [Hyphobacterium marinum]|uniref:Hpt domain-containing protein n=1 Tax=Hyphobacterium marinum TaxID=3116574 RepID=A0ABU7M2H6_9PROT|nr:Hpt domain-containing protein [Hyphobacterium sp. Y6023]MEE2567737.1 Hpt domain-containing protein [Hyphobacterium sp. Y6023]
MAKQQPIEVITPPNMLRVKVGGRVGPIDDAAIARAEAALDNMRDDFTEWLEAEVVKLEAAGKAVMAEGVKGEAGAKLFAVAHDLRGLGTTYNYPIITRMAASLCKMIETEDKRAAAPAPLAVAHAHAIRAALRQNIKTVDNAVGKTLVEELEAQVAAFAAPWEDQPAMRAAG